ncbi:alpha/beta hydrolase [Salipiger sp. PrR003]|uniref:alpha/beta hydrolase n=1 Tax=Salipiger sp. PrR003 TaxID=2706776 RepID=UPI0013DB098D|nr:alpha/beta hydrolase [Salipiger sp. PrR003]NDV50354.1 hypothetical protein [Salipiger sp. PrR003]
MANPIINHPDIPVLHNDEFLKISYLEGEGDFCIVTFIGVGLGLGGVDIQSEEFKKINPALGNQVFIFDKQRSWGNNLDMAQIRDLIAPLTAGRRVVTMGLSMGGFLAIMGSSALDAETTIAMAPQYSVCPMVMPQENRWVAYTRKVRRWKVKSVDGFFNDETRYHCLFTDIRLETRHLDRFPRAGNISLYKVRGPIHNVGQVLKDQGLLYPTIEACIAGEAPPILPIEG